MGLHSVRYTILNQAQIESWFQSLTSQRIKMKNEVITIKTHVLLVHWIQSEYVPDPPLHSPRCPFPTPMILQHSFDHVGVCSACSWQCHCCLMGHTTHSPWHQLQGKGSSRRGWCWRARRKHEDQPGVAVIVVVQARACTQLEQYRPIWWETHLVAVAWHGRTALWPQPLPSTGAAGERRKFGVLLDVFIITGSLSALFPQVYILAYFPVYFLCFSHALLATWAWSISEYSRTLNVAESASQG